MDTSDYVYHGISILKSVTWLGIWALATYLFIPKSLHAWELWKKTKKSIHLSNAIGSIVLAFLAYSADFVIMVMKLIGWA